MEWEDLILVFKIRELDGEDIGEMKSLVSIKSLYNLIEDSETLYFGYGLIGLAELWYQSFMYWLFVYIFYYFHFTIIIYY